MIFFYGLLLLCGFIMAEQMAKPATRVVPRHGTGHHGGAVKHEDVEAKRQRLRTEYDNALKARNIKRADELQKQLDELEFKK